MIISEEAYLENDMIEISDFLDHHGVKGQKWGIRNKRRTQNYIDVGRGKATTSQKLRAAYNTGPIDLIKGRGFKGGAARKGAREKRASDNIANGKASARNILTRAAAIRSQDLIPTSKSRYNTKAAVGASIAGTILVNVGTTVIKRAIKK
jgi:hypothetical protein